MDLIVFHKNVQKLKLFVQSTDTLGQLLIALSAKLKVPADEIEIFYNDKPLTNSALTLKQCGLKMSQETISVGFKTVSKLGLRYKM